MSNTVYLAKSMPIDDSEPVHSVQIGDTPEAAKQAIIEATEDVAPASTIYNIEWVESERFGGYFATCRQGDWWFEIKEKDLHMEDEQ